MIWWAGSKSSDFPLVRENCHFLTFKTYETLLQRDSVYFKGSPDLMMLSDLTVSLISLQHRNLFLKVKITLLPTPKTSESSRILFRITDNASISD